MTKEENLRHHHAEAFIDGKYRTVQIITHTRGNRWLVRGSSLPAKYRCPDGARRVVVDRSNLARVRP